MPNPTITPVITNLASLPELYEATWDYAIGGPPQSAPTHENFYSDDDFAEEVEEVYDPETDSYITTHTSISPKKAFIARERKISIDPQTPLESTYFGQQTWAPLKPNFKDAALIYNNFKTVLGTVAPAEMFTSPPQIKFADSNCLVGVEVEIEGMEPIPILPNISSVFSASGMYASYISHLWDCKEDSSLKDQGLEYVTRLGTTAQQLPESLALLDSFNRIYYKNSTFSGRCGLHVHINIRDLTFEQYMNMMMLYLMYEYSFYRVSGNRMGNIFCVPLRASITGVEALFQLIENPSTFLTYDRLYHEFKVFKKYMAYNIRPFLQYGTVEFRHHEPTGDPHTLCTWVNKLLKLKQAATKRSYVELKDMIFKLNTASNYSHFNELMMEDTWEDIPLNILGKDLYAGCAAVKELIVLSQDIE